MAKSKEELEAEQVRVLWPLDEGFSLVLLFVSMDSSHAVCLFRQKAAKEKLDQILSTSAPKNLREGVGSGLSNIVKGAVGGAGVIVLLPYVVVINQRRNENVNGATNPGDCMLTLFIILLFLFSYRLAGGAMGAKNGGIIGG